MLQFRQKSGQNKLFYFAQSLLVVLLCVRVNKRVIGFVGSSCQCMKQECLL